MLTILNIFQGFILKVNTLLEHFGGVIPAQGGAPDFE